jgi:two-component system, LuxR family, response regulator FixJ
MARQVKSRPVVHIIDDDPAVVRMLTELVKAIGFDAEGYDSANKFLAASQRSGPGCLVLDVILPGMTGLVLQERMLAAANTLPIIFITGHADVRMAVEVMEKGAFGFLEKPFRKQELVDKIQKAIRRDQENWHLLQKRREADRRLASLTPAERRVLDRIAVGQTNKLIAEELGLSVRTVEVHRARIMAKLKVKSRADLLKLTAAASPAAAGDQAASSSKSR